MMSNRMKVTKSYRLFQSTFVDQPKFFFFLKIYSIIAERMINQSLTYQEKFMIKKTELFRLYFLHVNKF